MASIICRNTFLEIADEGVEAISHAQVGATKFRSKSADSVRSGGSKALEDTSGNIVEFQLVRLNQLLENPRPASPMKRQVSFEHSGFQSGAETFDSQGENDATSLSELMRLQRKLQQALVPSGMTNVLSANSISTMSNVLSTNSISTMCSLSEDDLLEMEAEAEESPTLASDRPKGRPFVARSPSGAKVPRSLDLAAEYNKKDVPKTTIMIRNIPNRYSQHKLVLELEDLGFSDTFDFVYMPMDKCTRGNLGYAFVNFLQPSSAEKCMECFQNYRFKRHRDMSNKVAAASIAHIQGLEANMNHYANSAVNSSRRRPVVLAKLSEAV